MMSISQISVCGESLPMDECRVIIYHESKQIEQKMMTYSNIEDMIYADDRWLIIDGQSQMYFPCPPLKLSKESVVEVDLTKPHLPMDISAPNFDEEKHFQTYYADGSANNHGSHTLEEINKLVLIPIIRVDGNKVNPLQVKLNLTENSGFYFMMPLRGCARIEVV